MDHIGSSRLRVGACLSLSGRFARFGRQAAYGLRVWQALDGNADVLIKDDASDVRTLQVILPQVAARSDLLLGPYSTVLTNAAVKMAAEAKLAAADSARRGEVQPPDSRRRRRICP